MNSKDEQHINDLIAQHKVRRINKMEATFINMLSGQGIGTVINANSFTGHGPATGGETVLYLGEDEADEEGSYFIALHEMGHVALGHHITKTTNQEKQVEQEIAAWQWALDNAKYEPSDSTLLMMQDAVATYTDHLAWLQSPERKKAGIEAIIYLNGMAGIKETEESALQGWEKLSTGQQDFTLSFHESIQRLDPERRAELEERIKGKKWRP